MGSLNNAISCLMKIWYEDYFNIECLLQVLPESGHKGSTILSEQADCGKPYLATHPWRKAWQHSSAVAWAIGIAS